MMKPDGMAVAKVELQINESKIFLSDEFPNMKMPSSSIVEGVRPPILYICMLMAWIILLVLQLQSVLLS
jgi:hypothetical protein